MKAVVTLVLLLLCFGNTLYAQVDYEPTEASLSRHTPAPEWFRDAKLGIYFHWGPYTVAAHANEWYPRWMHFDLKKEDWEGFTPGYHKDLLGWHTKRFGHPSEVGYHDLIPQFTGEHFDAAEWAELFQESGARFAGPVAMHHDGYAMWDSDVTPWNAADTGPKRDITGELARELRRRGMKLIATFHHARNLQRYKGMNYAQAREKYGHFDQYHVFWNSHYPWIDGLATASDDPKLRLLYGNLPEEQWLDEFWLGCLKEVIDKYQPDIVWFDTWLDQIPERTRYEYAAYYLNAARRWGKPVMTTHKHDDMPASFSVQDLEQGRRDKLTEDSWLTDATLTRWSWSYVEGQQIKPARQVIHEFIDIVSKNGQLLLNISPRADGTIPDEQRAVLAKLGGWLKTNGEAIYDTRPWSVFGEGPTRLEKGGHFTKKVDYNERDIRFTTKGDTLYAIALGTPRDGLTVASLSGGKRVASVTALSGDHVASWNQDDTGLRIKLVGDAPEQVAYAFRINFK